MRQLQISPELVRRWFKKHYDMTFQAYQRMYRINSAFQELKGGKKTIDAAFESGYESLSGFGYTYKKVVGKSPKFNSENSVILISRLTTVLGRCLFVLLKKAYVYLSLLIDVCLKLNLKTYKNY